MTDRADLVIRNAAVIDGTGAPPRPGGVAVTDARIAAVGDVDRIGGPQEVDAGGKVLAPGFIDVHTHDDRALLVDPAMTCKVSQGVTTVVTGNCGVSLAPLDIGRRPPAPLDLICDRPDGFYADFGGYLDRLDADPPAVNMLGQVGHSSLRVGAMEELGRPATAGEIRIMRERLEAALDAGAVGLSTGLFYPPASAAPTAEVIALAGALKPFNGLHTTHMRDESDRVVEALEESFAIGQAAQVPVVLSHHKCAGAANFGRSAETLGVIDAACRHQPIGLDAYPYVAASTMLDGDSVSSASKVMVTWSVPHPTAAGRDLSEIADELELSQDDAIEALKPAGGIFFMMDEADVRRILAHPRTMIGSDGLPHDRHPHPRLWGTFPRVLGHYAREVGLFTLEEAVFKMTGLPAKRFGLADRGVLRPGAFADLVLFDRDRISDSATFENPTTPAAGIELVVVNGRAVWRDGEHTSARPGRALRRQELAPFDF
ncbi:MAG: D-aminoacylase [Alphaproteobacteria bacterium]|nr:D-aminoacylase [Alphaproteobacteria bacterium]